MCTRTEMKDRGISQFNLHASCFIHDILAEHIAVSGRWQNCQSTGKKADCVDFGICSMLI